MLEYAAHLERFCAIRLVIKVMSRLWLPLSHRHLPQGVTAFCVDHELIYEPFFADFGPLNLGQSYRFCEKCDMLVKEAERKRGRVYFIAQSQPNFRANASALIGLYQVSICFFQNAFDLDGVEGGSFLFGRAMRASRRSYGEYCLYTDPFSVSLRFHGIDSSPATT